jgi:ferritin-like protein
MTEPTEERACGYYYQRTEYQVTGVGTTKLEALINLRVELENEIRNVNEAIEEEKLWLKNQAERERVE